MLSISFIMIGYALSVATAGGGFDDPYYRGKHNYFVPSVPSGYHSPPAPAPPSYNPPSPINYNPPVQRILPPPAPISFNPPAPAPIYGTGSSSRIQESGSESFRIHPALHNVRYPHQESVAAPDYGRPVFSPRGTAGRTY